MDCYASPRAQAERCDQRSGETTSDDSVPLRELRGLALGKRTLARRLHTQQLGIVGEKPKRCLLDDVVHHRAVILSAFFEHAKLPPSTGTVLEYVVDPVDV